MVEFRKLISFGKSSYIISLPKSWVDKNKLSKGSLIEVNEDEGHLKLAPNNDGKKQIDKKNLDVSGLGNMAVRSLHALYKQGVDEINVTFNTPDMINYVQKAIGKEAVGFEIIEQTRDRCYIKNIASGLEGFDVILRKTFLVLMSMADDSLDAIQKQEFNRLRNVSFLEEANNRFTTSCRRIINKGGIKNSKKIGPMYYVVEDLENLADEYKYLCNYLAEKNPKKVKIRPTVLENYAEVNKMLRELYEVFYKLDSKKIADIGETRKNLVANLVALFETSKDPGEIIIIHHLLVIVQKIFCFTGPLLTMEL